MKRLAYILLCAIIVLTGCGNREEISVQTGETDNPDIMIESTESELMITEEFVSATDNDPIDGEIEETIEEVKPVGLSVYEEVDGVISLMRNDEIDIPFDIIYADYDLESMTEWEDIRRYERCHHDGKVYEFIVSTQLVPMHNLTYEGLLLISDEDDKENYQVINQEVPGWQMLHEKTFYFEDVTYDGNKEVLIDYGGFGAQGCTYMGCYRYDDKTDEYVEITGFSSISNPELDSEGEYIFGSHRDTAVMHSYYAYKYSNGQFIEVYWLSSDYSDGEEIWCVNEVEIGRTNNINDLSTINDPVFKLFYREDGSRNPRIVSFVIY